MTPEERMEFHEQWLRSMESNLSEITDRQLRTERTVEMFVQQSLLNQGAIFTALAQLTTQVDGLAEQHRQLAEQHRQLAEDHRLLSQEFREFVQEIRQYVRGMGDGRGQN